MGTECRHGWGLVMSETSELIVAGVAVLGAAGATGKFVWNKIETRFTAIEDKLEECHDRELVSQERRAVQLTVIELLWQEVKRHVPDSQVLTRAGRLLDGLRSQQEG